jgi:prepilin-type N-terminal cleavage/methylation domain-containing protein
MRGMVALRSLIRADGFTLLEALVALALVAVLLVAGLETVGVGAAARRRAAAHAEVRLLAERKLAELATMSGSELAALAGKRTGTFPAPFEDVGWRVAIEELEPGAGLFVIRVDAQGPDAAVEVWTYVNRYGELWSRSRSGGR